MGDGPIEKAAARYRGLSCSITTLYPGAHAPGFMLSPSSTAYSAIGVLHAQTSQSVGHLLRHRFERLHRYWKPPTYHRVRHPTRGNCAAPSALFFRALSARRRVYERAREWLLQNRAGAVRLSASTA